MAQELLSWPGLLPRTSDFHITGTGEELSPKELFLFSIGME